MEEESQEAENNVNYWLESFNTQEADEEKLWFSIWSHVVNVGRIWLFPAKTVYNNNFFRENRTSLFTKNYSVENNILKVK